MTVCIATDGFAPGTGGIATFNRHLVRLLTGGGHSVIILVADYDAAQGEADAVTTEGKSVVVRLRKSYQDQLASWKKYFKPGGLGAASWIATGLAMRAWMQANHAVYNITVTEVSDYGGLGMFLANPTLPPVIVTGHGSLEQLSPYQYPNQDEQFALIRKLERGAYAHADGIIAHSPLNRESLARLADRDIYLCPIPWTGEQPATQTTVVAGKCVAIGGLQPVKGIYEMMEAVRLLREKQPALQVKWIGPDTWLAPGYQRMSVHLQKEYADIWGMNFHWAGAMSPDNTAMEIASAEMVVIPSTFDTFGYTAIETAYAGRPLIVTAGTGASYLFSNGIDAMVLPSNDPPLLADALLSLHEQPALREKLGEEARMGVVARLNEEAILSQRLRIYNDVITRRRTQADATPVWEGLLKRYRHPFRKYYYCIRGWIKRLLVSRP